MEKYVKVELVFKEGIIKDLKEKFGDKLTTIRLIKKAAEHPDTQTNFQRNLVGDGGKR